MEGQLWKLILVVLSELHKRRKRACQAFGDEDIVKVFYWSVIHDRPISWACQSCNGPWQQRRVALPSNSTMSRRLRTASVMDLLDRLEQRITRPTEQSVYWMIDGKPLPISCCSKDNQAGYGRAARCKAKGYKLHALINIQGAVASWRVAPMNADERTMAERMLKSASVQGYVVGDGNYDSNPLHKICDERGKQLIARRRGGPGRQLGHRRHQPGRLRSMALLEGPHREFGEHLLKDRSAIERYFGNTTSWGGGLTHLPPWVRTHRRVRRWVQAKLTLTALRRTISNKTYVKS